MRSVTTRPARTAASPAPSRRRLIVTPILFGAAFLVQLGFLLGPSASYARAHDAWGWDLDALRQGRIYLLWVDLFLPPNLTSGTLLVLFTAAATGVLEARHGPRWAAAGFLGIGPLATLLSTIAAWVLMGHGGPWAASYLVRPDVGGSTAGFACLAAATFGLGRTARNRWCGATMPFLLVPLVVPINSYGLGHVFGYAGGALAGWVLLRPRAAEATLVRLGIQERRGKVLVAIIAASAALNGLLEIERNLLIRYPGAMRIRDVLPFGLPIVGRTLALSFGAALLFLSFNLWQRKRLAWILALASALIVVASYMDHDDPWPFALAAVATASLLVAFADEFRVRSEPLHLGTAALLVVSSFAVAIGYGVAGFWLLDRRDFGVDFDLMSALQHTVRTFLLLGTPDLAAHTRHGRWFLEGLTGLALATYAVAAVLLFRPIVYRLRTQPHERAEAQRIIRQHPSSDLDFFKLLSDKAYYFSASRDSVVAYATFAGVAIALGDASGPSEEVAAAVHDWRRFCNEQGWLAAMLHLGPRHLTQYEAAGFRTVKIGESAFVELATFTSGAALEKRFRNIRSRFQRLGIRDAMAEPPHTAQLYERLHEVSDEWLELPGRRDRGFALGRFERHYVNVSRIFYLETSDGRLVAFASLHPTYSPGVARVDLMRHRLDAPNGATEYLFLRMLERLHAEGFRELDFGLAPLSGVRDWPDAGYEERALAVLYERLNRFFSFRGLRSFKDKFGPRWEPRFLAYQGGPAGLARTARALAKAMAPQRRHAHQLLGGTEDAGGNATLQEPDHDGSEEEATQEPGEVVEREFPVGRPREGDQQEGSG